MSQTIFELVDALPEGGLTVMSLRALDFAVPGQWQNLTGFENTIKAVTGESDQQVIQQVGERAIALFNDPSQGYQRALSIYRHVSAGSGALGAAALASKVGERIAFLSFLDKLTPKADTAQAIDLGVKLVAELVAFTQVNGIPGDSIGEFVGALKDYGGESLMRMAALVSFDALLPLGPDFLEKVGSTLGGLAPDQLARNPTYAKIAEYIPGDGAGGHLGFIGQAFGSAQGWMSDFVTSRGLTPERVLGSLKNFIDVSDDRLDYVSAFLDMTTNYYEHTGIQTVARRLVERAVAEI